MLSVVKSLNMCSLRADPHYRRSARAFLCPREIFRRSGERSQESSTKNECLTPGKPPSDPSQIFPRAEKRSSCNANKIDKSSETFLCYFLKVFEVSSPIFLQILLFGAISMYSSVRLLGAIYQHCTCLCSCFLHYFVG